LAAVATRIDEGLAYVSSGEKSPPTMDGVFALPYPAIAPSRSLRQDTELTFKANGTKRDNSKLGKCESALLRVLAARSDRGASMAQLGILSGYSVKSSTLANAVSKLRSLGYATKGLPVYATSEGIQAAGHVDPLPRGEALVSYWRTQVGKAESTMLEAIYHAH